MTSAGRLVRITGLVASVAACGSGARRVGGGGQGGTAGIGHGGAGVAGRGGGGAGTGGASGATGGAGGTGVSGTGGGAGVTGASGASGGAGVTGASGASGGAGATGASGTGGRAGATGASGTGGRAGATDAAGTGGASGGALAATAGLDGQEYLMPCGRTQSADWLVCENLPPVTTGPTCPYLGPYLTRGYVMRDDTIVIGGTPGAVYDVTIRVRGVVEPKHYMNGAQGAAANGTNYGWYVGGAPYEVGAYGVYMLWVSAPVVMQTALDGGTLDGQYYFLNSINKNEAHFAYPIDYTVTLPIAAGATVRFFADDSNCSMVKNCDDTSVDGINPPMAVCNPITIADLPASAAITQPYPGQFIYLNVVSATVE